MGLIGVRLLVLMLLWVVVKSVLAAKVEAAVDGRCQGNMLVLAGNRLLAVKLERVRLLLLLLVRLLCAV